MRGVRFLLIVSLLSTTACSKLFGKGGSGSEDAAGEGNIPMASAGSELGDVGFDYDSSNLSASAKETLRTNSQWLTDHPGQAVTIEGHCDERGTNEYNMALGMRRAQSVFEYVRSLGVEESRLSRVSYGEELPLVQGGGEAAWSKNRRAHFSMR